MHSQIFSACMYEILTVYLSDCVLRLPHIGYEGKNSQRKRSLKLFVVTLVINGLTKQCIPQPSYCYVQYRRNGIVKLSHVILRWTCACTLSCSPDKMQPHNRIEVKWNGCVVDMGWHRICCILDSQTFPDHKPSCTLCSYSALTLVSFPRLSCLDLLFALIHNNIWEWKTEGLGAFITWVDEGRHRRGGEADIQMHTD